MIPFVDLSSNNGAIDWPTLAKYLLAKDPDAGAIVKVSEGTDYVNTLLRQQRQGAHAAGLKPVGLYHFGRPSRCSGHEEAAYFLAGIGTDGGILRGEFLCLDLEDEHVAPDAPLQAYVDDFRGIITRALGIRVIVYCRDDYLAAHKVKVDPSDYWCAAPGALSPPKCAIWQYDWHGRLPGVSTEVDLNHLLTPLEQFRPVFCWGYQTDPIAGKPATGTPDIDKATDVPTTIKHVLSKLEEAPPDVTTAIADLSQCLTHNFGLAGA